MSYAPDQVFFGTSSATLGLTDYSAVTGYWDPSIPPGGNTYPVDIPVMNTGLLILGYVDQPDRRTSPVGATDGLSNTIALCELAGRPLSFQGRRLQSGSSRSGSWFLDGSFSLFGSNPDGSWVYPSGPCVVNGNNSGNQPYGFHPGGVLVVRGDGSVTMLRDGTTAAVVTAMITRAGGEILPGDSW